MKRYHVSNNKFDKSTATLGYYVQSSNGELAQSGNFFATDYIPIEPNKQYYWNDITTRANAGAFYDESKTYLSGWSNQVSNVFYFTVPTGAKYVRLTGARASIDDMQLNTGSTALPYEPYGNEWQTKSPPKYGTATETIQSGDTIYANGQPITTYNIKGNTETSGTPTPSNPITINGVGNKTANLLPPPTAAASGEINGITYNVSADGVCTFSGTASASVNITVDLSEQFVIPYSTPAGGQGTVAFNNTKALNAVVMFYNGSTQVDAWQLNVVDRVHTSYSGMAGKTIDKYIIQIASGVNADGLSVAVAFSDNGVPVSPFEPYGQYKIPISSGQTVNNYLGSIQSTRQINKIVFDGTETGWDKGTYAFYYTINDMYIRSQVICTHYEYYDGTSSSAPTNSISTASGVGTSIWIKTADHDTTTLDQWKAYLQAQYAAGTPVTVYYVLNTATTGTVNEPLMKIGTYSDSISNAVSIPTAEGANSITVDTTVQPSEFTATWTGWHDSSVKEYDGSDWQ